MKGVVPRRLGLLFLYGVLAVLGTHPLVFRLGDGVVHDRIDPLLNTWLLWWNARAVPFTDAWWNGPIFRPIPGALSFSENLVGLAPLTTPLQWLGASPLLAYNLAFILSFALSGFAMHRLARAVGLGTGPSFVAGFAYGFAPYRAAQLAHLQMLAAFFIPLLFLGAHRFVQGGRRGWLAVVAVAWLLQGLTNGYYLFFVSVLFAGWVAWFAASPERRGRVARVAVAWALAFACLAPVLLRYAHWHEHYGFRRSIEEIELLSADLVSLVQPPPDLAHWPDPTYAKAESWLFPGVTVPALLAVFLVAWWRRKEPGEGRLACAFATVAAVAATVAALTAVTGPWRLTLGGLSLSVKALSKPLAVANYALVLAAVSSRSFRGAWRRGSVPAFYLVAGLALMVLALGPNPGAGGVKFWDKAPYYYLLGLPGAATLRVPARFAMPAAFCLALAAAALLGRMVERRGRRGTALVAAAAAGVLWDGWLDRLPILDAPGAVALPAAAPVAAVLELPVDEERDALAMYRATAHGIPLVNGYSGFQPPHYTALRWGLSRREPGVLGVLREHGPLLVLVDRTATDAEALERLVASEAGVQALGDLDGRGAYVLPAVPPPAPPSLGAAVPAVPLHRSPRRGVFELARAGPVGGVELAFGGGVSDLPVRVSVEVGDTKAWTAAWNEPVAGLALRGALRDPRRVPVTSAFPPASGRLLRVGVTGGAWTIENVVAFRPAQAREERP